MLDNGINALRGLWAGFRTAGSCLRPPDPENRAGRRARPTPTCSPGGRPTPCRRIAGRALAEVKRPAWEIGDAQTGRRPPAAASHDRRVCASQRRRRRLQGARSVLWQTAPTRFLLGFARRAFFRE